MLSCFRFCIVFVIRLYECKCSIYIKNAKNTIKTTKKEQWSIMNIIPFSETADFFKGNNYSGTSLTSSIANTWNRMILSRIRPATEPYLRINQNRRLDIIIGLKTQTWFYSSSFRYTVHKSYMMDTPSYIINNLSRLRKVYTFLQNIHVPNETFLWYFVSVKLFKGIFNFS